MKTEQGWLVSAVTHGYELTDMARPDVLVKVEGKGAFEVAKELAAEPVLLAAAVEAADWLCDCEPGTDQHERGMKLRRAIEKAGVA